MTPAEALGRVITTRRTALGGKRKELCAAAGISYPYLSEIEKGNKEPAPNILRRLAWALHVEASQLWADAEAVQRGESITVLNRPPQ
jgi:transcriptional regulator with XRE-family HTH domain